MGIMESRAVARYVRISPYKTRLVVDLIRGKKVDEALKILKFTKKRSARIVEKVIRSAMANALQDSKIDVDNLFIKRIYVDEGPMLKRYRPMSMGRVGRIRRRTSHITVVLDEM